MSVAAATPWLALVTAAGLPAHRTTSPPAPRAPRDTDPLALLPLDSLRRDRSPLLLSKLSTLSEHRHDLGSVSLAHRRGFNSFDFAFERNTIS